MGNIIKLFSSFSLPVKIVVILVILLFLILPITLYAVKRSNDTIIPIPSNGIIKPTLIPFPSKNDYVPNELIIRFKDGMGPSDLKDSESEKVKKVFDSAGVISKKKLYNSEDPLLKYFYILKFKPGTAVEKAAQIIFELPQIGGVEPNVHATLNK